MVAVRLEGRLGNQLFQYAFIYATAKKLNTSYYIDKSIEQFIPAKYFNLKTDFLKPLDGIIAIPQIKKSFYRLFQKLMFGNKLINIDGYRSPASAITQIKDGYMYQGFFQSERYFEDVKTELKQQFSIKKTYVDEYAQLVQKMASPKKMIAVHIRRGDYVNLKLSLPLSYYKTALEAAGYHDAYCVFISDDPDFIKAEFDYIQNKYISSNSEIIDLQFLMNADVCILSNSSFSWWGSWLNNRPEKTMYAPKNWLNFNGDTEYPAGIADNLNFNWLPAGHD